MSIDWKKNDEDARVQFEKDCKLQMKRSAADFDFSNATLNAKHWCKDFHPSRGEYGELKYTRQQVFEAACHSREDISAILQIQLPTLKRLDSIKKMLWVCMALLAYIAAKLS